MDRLACVELPSFALQLALQAHPEWQGQPLALLSRPTAQGEVLEVCRKATGLGVRPGMTRSVALSLAPALRTEVAAAVDLTAGRQLVVERLRRYSPRVESSQSRDGGFLVDLRGLEALHPDLGVLAQKLRDDLKILNLYATVVVGFSRFGVEAVARAARGSFVLESVSDETEAACRVPLSCLGLPPRITLSLAKLGVTTVAQLLRLPADGLRERFGEAVYRLHRRAKGELPNLFQPEAQDEPLEERLILDYPEQDSARLTFIVRRLIVLLLSQAAARGQAVTALSLALVLQRDPPRVERIGAAQATLDALRLAELARLRLEQLWLPSGVVELHLRAETERATATQLELFARTCRRDPEQVTWTLARLRAELGARAVVRSTLRPGHLPEARFELVPLDEQDARNLSAPRQAPATETSAPRPLVRRIYTKPVPLPRRPVCGPRGCHLQGLDEPPSEAQLGPYVVSGQWWDSEVHREYSFVTDADGRICWVYFDRIRHAWYLHAEVG